ncbi:hexokinase, partial [Mycena olivaceomarginata]
VVLRGDTTFTLRQQKYKVSDALKTGEASVLFDYLADSVDASLTSHPPSSHGNRDPFVEPTSDVVHLGLTFSLRVEQTALDSGKILTWTKGFSAKHAIGNDVVKLLQDAFDRKHMHVKCVALVNDVCTFLIPGLCPVS